MGEGRDGPVPRGVPSGMMLPAGFEPSCVPRITNPVTFEPQEVDFLVRSHFMASSVAHRGEGSSDDPASDGYAATPAMAFSSAAWRSAERQSRRSPIEVWSGVHFQAGLRRSRIETGGPII